MSTLDHIIDSILEREGRSAFTNDPDDRGGATRWGITQRTLAEFRGRAVSIAEVQVLTESEARDIYRQLYAIRPGLVKLTNYDVLELAIDCAVQHDPVDAVKMVQRAARVFPDGIFGPKTESAANSMRPSALYRRLCAERTKFYAEIVIHDPSQLKWFRGWTNRLCSFIERTLP